MTNRTPWPGCEGHSRQGRPNVYRGRETGTWWVDYSFDADQRGFETWPEALAFALSTITTERTR
jgi:hypothetical protein